MAVRIESQAEPIPGYKLVERLGGGGFGEVWKAVAPGGLLKAIKFVYGDLEQTEDEDGQRAGQELKAMSRVKTVRHPYILSLERYDIVDGQLMIVMELADRNLWDRFRECRSQGLPGIPREELLRYMEETAEALDLMNIQYQLQHLDIKPQNIFLVHNHVKVADFGLVKDLEGMSASVTGGVTPVYAAPETFDGWVSRFCDQYSLAIMYQELLTGHRPFAGSNVRQLIVQHLQGIPNLEPLPPSDREAVGRALAKSPDSRFPSCQLFVNVLRAGSSRDGAAGQTASGSTAAPATGTPMDGTRTPGVQSPSREPGVREPESPPAGDSRVQKLPPGVLDLGAKAEESPAPRARVPKIEGEGVLFPALVIGLGQAGLGVLQRLREVSAEHVGPPDLLPNIRCLYLDTDPEAHRAATSPRVGAALAPEEVVLARLNRPSHYLRSREGRSHIDAWFNPKMLYRIPRNLITTGMRALGRLAFCDNYRQISRRLRTDLEACTQRDALTATATQKALGMRTNRPRVYVVANLAGGTGSGMFLDVAYVVRMLLSELGYETANVVGMFLLPAVDRNPSRTLALGNTFAALTELHHFSRTGTMFTARYGEKESRLNNPEPPFNQCFLLTVPERADGTALDEATARVASLLYRDLCTPLGRTADSSRATLPTLEKSADELSCHTFAMYRFSWPRRALCQRVARHLCKEIVRRWMTKDSGPIRETVQAWVQEQWTREQLAAECLIARLQVACEQSLGRVPESVFGAVLEPVGLLLNGPPEQALAGMKQALAQIEEIVGRPESGTGNRPLPLKEALDQAAETTVSAWGQKMAELAVRLIELPEYRLAGAEEALRQFVATIEKVLHHYEPLVKELSARVTDSHSRIVNMLSNTQELAAGGRRAATYLTNLLDLLRVFPKWRYQSLVLNRVASAYVSLRGYLSDQLRDVNYCRARLTDLQRAFENATPLTAARGEHGSGRNFFPAGCRKLEEAVQEFLASVTPQDMQELDGRIQNVISQQFTALVYVCLSSNNLIKNLEVAMQQEAEAFADAAVGRASVAEMFLAQYGQDEDAQRAIDAAYAEAAPESIGQSGSPENEFCILATPPGPAGERFTELARQVLEQVQPIMTTSPDDIVFYREAPHLALADLEQLGPVAHEAYQQMTSLEHFTPHSRTDITDWQAVGD